MKLETVLKAAVNAMVRGHRQAHCFRAHVPGLGYVNDGNLLFHRADYLVQLERSARSEIDNMGFAQDYAEPGCKKPRSGILFANWNHLPKNLDRILEHMGYAVEWSDEWAICDCGKAFRTSGDSFCWEPAFKEINGQLLCLECAKTEEE